MENKETKPIKYILYKKGQDSHLGLLKNDKIVEMTKITIDNFQFYNEIKADQEYILNVSVKKNNPNMIIFSELREVPETFTVTTEEIPGFCYLTTFDLKQLKETSTFNIFKGNFPFGCYPTRDIVLLDNKTEVAIFNCEKKTIEVWNLEEKKITREFNLVEQLGFEPQGMLNHLKLIKSKFDNILTIYHRKQNMIFQINPENFSFESYPINEVFVGKIYQVVIFNNLVSQEEVIFVECNRIFNFRIVKYNFKKNEKKEVKLNAEYCYVNDFVGDKVLVIYQDDEYTPLPKIGVVNFTELKIEKIIDLKLLDHKNQFDRVFYYDENILTDTGEIVDIVNDKIVGKISEENIKITSII